MSKLNEMLQSHRDNTAIVQPLLKTLLVLSRSTESVDADSKDSAGDILSLLTSSIASTMPSDPIKTNYLKVCLNVLDRIRNLVPEARDVTKQLVKDQLSSIKEILIDFDAIFESKERLQVVCQSLAKYKLFIS